MWAFDKPLVWVIILVIVIILFGASRLPEIGKGLGRSIREFKEETKNGMEEKKPVDAVVGESKPVTAASNGANVTTEAAIRRRIIKHPDGREEIIEEPIVK